MNDDRLEGWRAVLLVSAMCLVIAIVIIGVAAELAAIMIEANARAMLAARVKKGPRNGGPEDDGEVVVVVMPSPVSHPSPDREPAAP